MPVHWDATCRAALDRAGQSVGDGEALDALRLLEALFDVAGWKGRQELGPLAAVLHPPRKVRDDLAVVRITPALQAVFRSLHEQEVGPVQLLVALLGAADVRQALRDRGLQDDPVELALRLPSVAPSMTEARLRELSAFGTFLTRPGGGPHRPGGRRSPIEDAGGPLSIDLALSGRPLEQLLLHLAVPRSRGILLVAAPGTGKTVLVHSLARHLMQPPERLPAALRGLDVLELPPGFPMSEGDAGARRLQTLFRTLGGLGRIVLFVDRIMAFAAGLKAMHLLGQLERLLDDGAVSCIGCLAPEELAAFGDLGPGFLRRFRVMRLTPPTREETVQVLVARRPLLEQHFGLSVPDELLPLTVRLADEHVPERSQPDRSLRLLEAACAEAALERPAPAALAQDHLARAVQQLSPGPLILPSSRLTVEHLEKVLADAIIGQDEVLAAVARAFVIGRSELGLLVRRGPRGVFLFGGPTGVGKTETALQLARQLGDRQDALIRVDCQNLQGGGGGEEGFAIGWRLLGVAPGYRGHVPGCKDGLLVKVRDFPESILLLDEFEKADPGLGRLFLRILDEGKAQDSEGNDLDFSRCFVILTTNAGVQVADGRWPGLPVPHRAAQEEGVPFVSRESLEAGLLGVGLGPELLARIHHTFLFRSLTREDVGRVVRKELDELSRLASARGFSLDCDSDAVARLAQMWDRARGVRHAETLIRDHVTGPLAILAYEGKLAGVRSIRVAVGPPGGGSGSQAAVQGEQLTISLPAPAV